MADAPQFWTPDFIEAFVDALNADSEFRSKAKGFSNTIVFRCLDHPSGEDVEAAYTFEDGECTEVGLWIEDAPSSDFREDPFDKKAAMARATAPYSIWVQLDQGEMTPLGALTSPDYQIEGPKLKIMANMNVLNGMSDVSAKLDKTY